MMKMKQHSFSSLFLRILSIALFCLLALTALSACGPTVNVPPVQQAVTVNPSFQEQLSPVPTATTYRCGAWSSNNAPNANSTIIIYAKLTRNAQAVSGATAQAVVNFQSGSVPLDQHPTSDIGGYVSFTLPLEGRQPNLVPATVDVTFTVDTTKVSCQAFFAPE
jgi:hypothetical protein